MVAEVDTAFVCGVHDSRMRAQFNLPVISEQLNIDIWKVQLIQFNLGTIIINMNLNTWAVAIHLRNICGGQPEHVQSVSERTPFCIWLFK